MNKYFNKQCLNFDIIPKLKNIKIKATYPGSKHTQEKPQKLRIKGELKYLYTNKILFDDNIYVNFHKIIKGGY